MFRSNDPETRKGRRNDSLLEKFSVSLALRVVLVYSTIFLTSFLIVAMGYPSTDAMAVHKTHLIVSAAGLALLLLLLDNAVRILFEKRLRNAVEQVAASIRRMGDDMSLPFDPMAALPNFADEFSPITEELEKLRREYRVCFKSLKKNEEKYHNMVEDAVAGFFQMSPDGRFVFLTRAVSDIFGYDDPEDMVHLSFQEDSADSKTFVETINKLGKVYDYEAKTSTADKSTVWISIHARTVSGDNGKPLYIEGTVADITARKQRDCRMAANEKKYRDIEKTFREGFVRMDLDGRIEECNQAFRRMLGYSSEELAGMTRERITPEHQLRQEEAVVRDQVMLRGYSDTFEKELIRKDGSSFPAELRLYLARDDRGAADGIWALVRNITRRKKAETALRQSEESFRKLSSAGTEAVFIHDSGTILMANQTALDMFGYQADDLEGSRLTRLAAPESRDLVAKQIESKGETPFEVVCERKNGEKFFTEIRGNSIIFQGKIAQSVVVRNTTDRTVFRALLAASKSVRETAFKNISDKQRAEKALRESETRFATLSESAVSAFFIVQKGRFLYMSKAGENILGYRQDNFLSMSLPELVHPEMRDFIVDELRSRMESPGPGKRYELKMLAKSGDIKWIDMTATYFEYGELPAVLCSAVDITERKEAEERLQRAKLNLEIRVRERTTDLVAANRALQQEVAERKRAERELKTAKEQAEAANNSKSVFLANMSHEIRTPLNAIFGFTEILENQIADRTHKKYLASIASSGKTLMALLNDILDLSRIEAGKIEIKNAPVDIREVLDETRSIFSISAEKKGIRLVLRTDPDLPETLVMDEVRLRQVLLNLVGNAVKFTDAGDVEIATSFEFSDNSKKRVQLALSVRDSGIGIDEDQIDLVFEAFQQQKGQDASLYGGTGLGLAITKGLVEMMGGTICASSVKGSGSTFTAQFYDVEVSDRKVFREKVCGQSGFGVFRPATVLIADDVLSNREVLKTFLEEMRLVAVEARNGKEAVRIAETIKLDLVLADIKMPVMDGFEMLKAFRASPKLKTVPVVAVSATFQFKDLEAESDFPFDGYVAKPITRALLIEEMRKFLPYCPDTTAREDNRNVLPADRSFGFSGDLPPEVCVNMDELIQSLENRFLVKWEKVSNSFYINDIEKFAKDILGWSEPHGVVALNRWAAQIVEQAECFDMEKLPRTFALFPSVIEKLKSISRQLPDER